MSDEENGYNGALLCQVKFRALCVSWGGENEAGTERVVNITARYLFKEMFC